MYPVSIPGVRIHDLGPGRADILDTVFGGMSTTSRYRRYHSGIPALTPRTRTVLSAVDGRRHIAVVAYAGADPVGIARLVAIDRRQADLAVEVVDAWQHRGIGTALLRAVFTAGARAGFTEVVADVLAENSPMLRLLALLLPDHTRHPCGPEVRLIASLENTVSPNPLVDQHRSELLAAARDHRLASTGRARARRATGARQVLGTLAALPLPWRCRRVSPVP
ncbi:hypothetical protein GCM10009836_50260 [Pseudonocardia ailaonensis]|uniref:N-acetyltransferase domain-containing protein n=1 Tax=Pseudonocardia ailaonensis TaxID=367279 RepID=A0ABN2NDA3_9PSEU